MNNLRTLLEAKKSKNEKILSIYLTAGFPDPQTTLLLLKTLAEAGVDLIELGAPFSDPQADGPVIQDASQQALRAGMKIPALFPIIKEFRQVSDVPVILMGYANPFMKYGWQRTVDEAVAAGANGFIIPDLPPEESRDFREKCRKAELDLIFLVSPVTTVERIAAISKMTTGFIYAVSVAGVTGERQHLPDATTMFLHRLREQTSQPVLVGFGVSNSETAKNLARISDGVIIGSAIIRLISESKNTKESCEKVSDFVRKIKLGLGECA
ncbi:MAG: tryptophan synthase subunit alpha [Calditrichaeota bacterium]|nr:MAG: tryptophan synthase subunit alpha [Calditrichota bacterium]